MIICSTKFNDVICITFQILNQIPLYSLGSGMSSPLLAENFSSPAKAPKIAFLALSYKAEGERLSMESKTGSVKGIYVVKDFLNSGSYLA